MASATDFPITEYGVAGTNARISMPLGANITIAGGAIVLTDASGNVKDAASSVSSTDVCWGLAEYRRPFLAAATSSVAGTYQVPIVCGAFYLNSGSGADALSQATVGKTVYVINENTVGLTSNVGTRPVAGTHYNVDSTQPGGYAIKLGNGGP
jgi:hypothetical protein